MNEVAILRGTEPRKILQTAIEKKVPAVMSYQSRGKQRTAKVLLTNLGANRLDIQFAPRQTLPNSHGPGEDKSQNRRPADIQINRQVTISLKYRYGKFTFETTVVSLKPSSKHLAKDSQTIVVAVPDRIEIAQKRNFFRVSVPDSLKVNVTIWCGCQTDNQSEEQQAQSRDTDSTPPKQNWLGKLIDISTGGMQIAVDAKQQPDFRKEQFLHLKFAPTPYEAPLTLCAQVRNILHTADEKSICLGMNVAGSKSGQPDQQVLRRLCNIAEHYYQINQYSTRQQDFQTTDLPG